LIIMPGRYAEAYRQQHPEDNRPKLVHKTHCFLKMTPLIFRAVSSHLEK
jgi:hypothetical protein